jgi:hypothetical protein
VVKILYPNGQESFDPYFENDALIKILNRDYPSEDTVTLSSFELRQILSELYNSGTELNDLINKYTSVLFELDPLLDWNQYVKIKRLRLSALDNLQSIAETVKQLADIVDQECNIQYNE